MPTTALEVDAYTPSFAFARRQVAADVRLLLNSSITTDDLASTRV